MMVWVLSSLSPRTLWEWKCDIIQVEKTEWQWCDKDVICKLLMWRYEISSSAPEAELLEQVLLSTNLYKFSVQWEHAQDFAWGSFLLQDPHRWLTQVQLYSRTCTVQFCWEFRARQHVSSGILQTLPKEVSTSMWGLYYACFWFAVNRSLMPIHERQDFVLKVLLEFQKLTGISFCSALCK